MQAKTIALDLANESDFEFYHMIKSESSSVYWSGFGSSPNKESLREHYMTLLKTKSRDLYILKESDIRIGYLCVDKDYGNLEAEISYGVSE